MLRVSEIEIEQNQPTSTLSLEDVTYVCVGLQLLLRTRSNHQVPADSWRRRAEHVPGTTRSEHPV